MLFLCSISGTNFLYSLFKNRADFRLIMKVYIYIINIYIWKYSALIYKESTYVYLYFCHISAEPTFYAYKNPTIPTG